MRGYQRGILLGEMGQTAESLMAHRQALAIRRPLAEKHPGDAALQRDVESSLFHLRRLRGSP